MNYDAIVIGAGAGGGIAAALLSESGARVLLLERGKPHSFATEQTDHLRNHRLSQYGQNTGPGPGNPRVFVDAQQQSHVVQPHEGQYHNNAVTVGGGTVVYGGQAWRFLPDDFAMASRYGVPKGSSLADWPIVIPIWLPTMSGLSTKLVLQVTVKRLLQCGLVLNHTQCLPLI